MQDQISLAVESNNADQVLACLQSGLIYTSPYFHLNSSQEIWVLLELSGARLYTGNDPVELHILVMRKLFCDICVDMRKITINHVMQILPIVNECEPPSDRPYNYACCYHTIDDMQREVTQDNVSWYLDDAVSTGKPELIKWLLERYELEPTDLPLFKAAEEGFVSASELLIMEGAAMNQYPSPEWPWWVRNTESRIAPIRQRILDAISIVSAGQGYFSCLPPEILEKIIHYIWTSRFDLASWNGERDWNTSKKRVMMILRGAIKDI